MLAEHVFLTRYVILELGCYFVAFQNEQMRLQVMLQVIGHGIWLLFFGKFSGNCSNIS